MPLYQHRFRGHTAMGDTFVFSWWANDSRSTTDANDAAAVWITDVMAGATAGNGLEDHLTDEVGFDVVSTGRITVLTGLQDQLAETPVNLDGVDAGSALPGDVALVVSLRTGLANRSGRGRFYLPQPAASSLTALGKVAADVITDLNASLQAAWDTYNSATARPVVYSRTLRQTNDITSFDIGDLFDTQRRRENAITENRTTQAMP